MKIKNKKNLFYSKGFGIVEVLISAMLIVLIAGSAIGLSREILRRNVTAGQRVTAFNLAREYLEIARNARDTAIIDKESGNWDSYFDCSVNTECYFVWDNNTKKWNSRSGQNRETIDNVSYTRNYTLERIPNGAVLNQFNNLAQGNSLAIYNLRDQIWRVVVTITWNNGSQSLNAVTILTNWSPEV